jgi:hypothetical protein
MADLVNELAERSGVSADVARKGLGAVLSFVKGKLPAETFAKVSNAVPDADHLMNSAETAAGQPSQRGVLGAITGAAGKIFGGGGAGLAGKLAQLGFSADQVPGFLRNVLASLKDKVPGDAMKQLTSGLPT